MKSDNGPDEIDMEHLDARWDALSAGELSDEEAAALAALDPAAALALAPLGSGFASRLSAELAVISPPSAPAPRRRRWLWAPRLLAALAVLCVVRLGVVISASPTALPSYRLLARPGDLPERSNSTDSDAVMTLATGSAMRLLIRPHTRPESPTQVVVFSQTAQGWAPLSLKVSSNGGVHRLVGTVGDDLSLSAGPHTLLIGVGPAGPVGLLERAAPVRGWRAIFSGDALDTAMQDPPEHWTFWQHEVIISTK